MAVHGMRIGQQPQSAILKREDQLCVSISLHTLKSLGKHLHPDAAVF
jgi:hypothetical protein